MRFLLLALSVAACWADVGDPQVKTDHPFYPGELACSTFERLFATEAEQFQRITGAAPKSDEEKALAAWYWRNTHYFHGEEGAEDLWGEGFTKGELRTREYWTGLFGHGFGLCGTTHSQWTAEMEALFGHGRARGVGVEGHNSFEVFLQGGAYGEGRWALLDHDISTVIFDGSGQRLLPIAEIKPDVKHWTDRTFMPEKQHGWLVCGLHPNDGGVYSAYNTAEYFPGYAAVPPMVHLRRGETLRRYLEPGLEDGKTFVFWGRNYKTEKIPGPERSITWVNQPEKMFSSKNGAGFHAGQARYGNAVYTYRPDFKSGDYREGVIAETTNSVTFEFYTPYIIGATPPDSSDWGIYEQGGRNGLVVEGRGKAPIEVSVDQGAHWKSGGALDGRIDLTDFAKGHRQYWIRFGAGATDLAKADLRMRTVCQAAVGILPRLKDNGSAVTFEASNRAVVSAGPNLPQAEAHVIAGRFGSPNVTLQLGTPRGEKAVEIFASAHVASGNPPATNVSYQIEYSIDGGKSWRPVVKDWSIPHRGEEPPDFWSQSFCYGSVKLEQDATAALVRFRNNGGKNYLRAEAHLVYRTTSGDATKVTFAWSDSQGEHEQAQTFGSGPGVFKTGGQTKTRWVEMEPVWGR